MKGLEFPIIGTKTKGLVEKFNLSDPKERNRYFKVKAGKEIEAIKEYFETGTFIAYFLGKKNSGKGTYSKLFTEIFGQERVEHISVGDIVREYGEKWNKKFEKTKEFKDIKNYYRGYVSFDEAVKRFLGRSTEGNLLPTEFVLALLKYKISTLGKKSIFIDGLPRDLDQISYSLYFRDLINYRDDPDFFILIDIPESIIAERIRTRVICPKCHTSRNTKLHVTSKVDYDKKEKKFYLLCDNPECPGEERMIPKEGDDLGIEPIRNRLDKDEEILKKVFELHGVPKILLRNHVPVKEALKYFDSYEITPEYVLSWNEKKQKVLVTEKPWKIKDDNGLESNSLLAPPVVLALIKQLYNALNL